MNTIAILIASILLAIGVFAIIVIIFVNLEKKPLPGKPTAEFRAGRGRGKPAPVASLSVEPDEQIDHGY